MQLPDVDHELVEEPPISVLKTHEHIACGCDMFCSSRFSRHSWGGRPEAAGLIEPCVDFSFLLYPLICSKIPWSTLQPSKHYVKHLVGVGTVNLQGSGQPRLDSRAMLDPWRVPPC